MLDLYYYTSSLVITSDIVISHYQYLYDTLQSDNLTEYPHLRFFIEAIRNLHRACPCDHAKIIESIEKAFKLLPEVITPEERQFLMTKLNAKNVVFLI